MRRLSFVVLLVCTLLNQSLVYATPVATNSCEDFMNSEPWAPGKAAITLDHKLDFVETAVRSQSRHALDGIEVARRIGAEKQKIEKHLSGINFERLTPNNILTIHDHIAQLPFTVRKQLYLKLTGNGHLAEENFNTTRIANDLMKKGLIRFVKENGGIQDEHIRDHYRVYMKKYFPLVNLIFASIYTAFTGFDLPAVISNFQSLFNSNYSAVGFLSLPEKVQEDIFLNGLVKVAPETRESLRTKSYLSLNYEITSKIMNTIGTLIALAFLLDQLSHHFLGFTFGNVFDDIFNRNQIEEAAYESVTSGMTASGIPFDETYVRAQIHQQSLRTIEIEKNEH